MRNNYERKGISDLNFISFPFTLQQMLLGLLPLKGFKSGRRQQKKEASWKARENQKELS